MGFYGVYTQLVHSVKESITSYMKSHSSFDAKHVVYLYLLFVDYMDIEFVTKTEY